MTGTESFFDPDAQAMADQMRKEIREAFAVGLYFAGTSLRRWLDGGA